MDPRTIEINSLRVLNDYLNQTIDALMRGQRGVGATPFTAGLSHAPFTTAAAPWGLGASYFGQTPYAAWSPLSFGAPYASPMVDPMVRALSHTTWGSPLVPFARPWFGV